MIISILVLVLALGGLIAYSLSLRKQNAKRVLHERLAKSNTTSAIGPTIPQGSWITDQITAALKKLMDGGALAQPLAKMQKSLSQAGLEVSEAQLLTLHAIGGCAGGMVGILLLRNILGFIMGGVLGALIPFIIIRHLGSKRAKAFDRIFGDAVVLMTATIRSGFALRQAMQVVAEEMPAPICEEFKITIAEINMGLSQDEALKNLALRMPNEDLDLFVTAVLIQGDIGGDLSSVLEKISNTIRERIQMRNEIGALTAQGKMSGILVAALPVFILAAIGAINPSYIKVLFSTGTGHMILGGAVLMEGIGGFVISKLIKVE